MSMTYFSKALALLCVVGISHNVYCESLELESRGKGREDEPEYFEDVLTSFGISGVSNLRALRQTNATQGYRDLSKRGNVQTVRKWTVYGSNGKPFTDDIKDLCMKGHNYLRSQHKDTMPVRYDERIARDAEEYAKYLAGNGRFEHDRKIFGKLGENLYRMDNTYNLKASPVHGIMSWYEESWKPLKGPKRNYNYNWNPKTGNEIMNSGVGHFTQFVWRATTVIGCGVASTTYRDGGRTWTRTVMVTRYNEPGNVPYRFPANVRPLIGKSLQGFKRGRLYTVKCTKTPKAGKSCMKWKDKSDCVNTVLPKECANWKRYKWCDREWAKRDCHCTCG